MSQPDATQSNVSYQASQMDEYSLFHYTPSDDNFYHVTCKILHDVVHLDDHYYDHGFFYQANDSAANSYYVTCKSLSRSSIVNILNREIYGTDVGVNDSR